MIGHEHESSPRALDWIASALVVLAAVAFALIRVQAVNLPWHLATARLAQATGHWPAHNTFSYTFPDHPVYQQYPAFQATLWSLYQLAGFAGLSVLTGVGWIAVLLIFFRWAGPWREGIRLHAFWMLALYALQRRMILRPDLFSMLALGLELIFLDAYTRGRRWAIMGVPLAHLFWVNSHQLFPVSLLVQGLFVVHLLALRRPRLRHGGQNGQDEPPPPLAPVLGALALSIALCFATPLGLGILQAPARTAKSLALFRGHVAEFQRVWTMPLEFGLTLLTGGPAAWALWRARRAPSVFDLGLWLLSLALVVAAVRGLMFFGVISIAVAQRAAARCRAAGIALVPGFGPTARRGLRLVGCALTTILAGNVVYHRWIAPPYVLGGTQPGLGPSIGGWAESATAFLARTPPPGRMMNLGPGLGDLMIWSAPGIPVFVDSRLESYPVEFLREVIGSDRDDQSLEALIRKFDVRWIFAEHFRDPIRARAVHMLANGWAPVYVDSDYLVLVRESLEAGAYIGAHRVDLSRALPADLVAAPLSLRAQQRAHFARLMSALGATARVEEQRRAAFAESGTAGQAAFAGL
jgi:hypothetical protein